jgi:SAM-dependent methyltransferase
MTPVDITEPFTRDLGRSVDLLKAFRSQYADPDGFYSRLASDTASLVARHAPLHGRRILDVGSGPGYFGDAFRIAGARCCSMEIEIKSLFARGVPPAQAIVGDGEQMPIAEASFDICHSSNAIEHVPRPHDFLSEMIRVVRPGGLVFLAFTNWYSPFGGHETSPWHYFGGEWAARRYERKTGRQPTNRYGVGLFRLHIRDALGWAGQDDRADVVDVFPRYYPAWASWVARVPGLREVATWNVVLILRRR